MFENQGLSGLDALVELQNKNSIAINATLDRQDGVLASAFSAEDFAAINNDLAIVVCVHGEPAKLLGFVCCSRPAFNQGAGLPKAMMARFDQTQFGGKSLTQWSCVIVGPVCVDKASRGTGVFEGLYEKLWQLIPAPYEIALALVSTTNPRSLSAHKKLAMIEVDQFIYNDKTYNTIARIIGQQKS